MTTDIPELELRVLNLLAELFVIWRHQFSDCIRNDNIRHLTRKQTLFIEELQIKCCFPRTTI